MKVALLLIALAVAEAVPTKGLFGHYHEDVGIPEALRVKTAEDNNARIVGGTAARLGEFPYLVGLVISLTNGAKSICGSSMLTNRRAVTAAHCWWDGKYQAERFTMVFGSTKMFYGGVRMDTNMVEVHERYDTYNLRNDVAMITFDYVGYTDVIRNIALPTGSLLYADFVGYYAEAAGYGKTRDTSVVTDEQSQNHVTLQVITNERCRRQYEGVIVDSTLCTSGDGGRSTCGGDSGGPLVIESSGYPVLIGITSFGSQWSCERGYPAGFSRVTAFFSWIVTRI